jgi:hypothetical protein
VHYNVEPILASCMPWPKVQFFALDVVMDIVTGNPFGDLVHNEDRYEYLKSTADSLPAIAMVSSIPWAGKILQSEWIAPLIAPASSEYGIGNIVEHSWTLLFISPY